MRTAPTPWSNTRRAQSSSPSIGHIKKKEKPLPSWNLQEMLTSYQEFGLLPPILSPTIPQNEEQAEDVPLSMLSPTLPRQFTLEHPAPKRAKPPLQQEVAQLSQASQKVKVRWINKLNQPHPRFMLRMNFDRQTYQQAFKVTGLGISSGDVPVSTSGPSVSTLVARLHRLLKEAKGECDRASNEQLVVALADYLLLQIALSTQEKSSESWKRASELCKRLSGALTSHPKAISLRGATCMVHAVILRQEIIALKETLEKISAQEKTIDIQKKIIRKYGEIEQYLRRAAQYSSKMASELPATFQKLLNTPPSSRKVMEPSQEPYMLPLGSFSGIGEACGLLYQAVSEIKQHKWKVDGVKVEI